MTYTVHTTLKSNNVKTGKIPVTTTSAKTCPDTCPFKKNGCYADGGPLALHWQKVTDGLRGDSWSTFIDKVKGFKAGQLWRHNQAGDLAGDGKRLDAAANEELAHANKGRRGFTYTHYNVLTDKHNARVVERLNELGFTVNLSGNSLAHADALCDLDIAPVTVVLPETQTTNTTTPKGRKVVVCPATIKDNVSCATCQLCARQRDTIVGFPAHGVSKRKANEIAMH